MAVSREEILRIAALAELQVDDAALAELEAQLTRILDYVAQLDTLPGAGDGDDVAAPVRLREDVVAADPLRRAPAEFAPGFRQGLFVVPRIGDADRGEDAP